MPELCQTRMALSKTCAALLAAHYTAGDKEQEQKAQGRAQQKSTGKFEKRTSKEAQQYLKSKGSSSTKCLRITVKSITQVLR